MPYIAFYEITQKNRGRLFSLLLLTLFNGIVEAANDVSGRMETELSFGKDFQGKQVGDLMQTRVEIDMDHSINPLTNAHIQLLYKNDGETPLDIDEALVEITRLFNTKMTLTIGQQYLPFGNFRTNRISDPFTLKLAETQESAVMVGYGDIVRLRVYLYNGSVEKVGEANTIGNFGASLDYWRSSPSNETRLGIDYINNIGDSKSLSRLIRQSALADESGIGGDGYTGHYVPGFASHLDIHMDRFNFNAEHIVALDEFESPEIRVGKAKPSALNVEAGWQYNDQTLVAVGVQHSVDAEALALPEFRVLLTYSRSFQDGQTMSLEYHQDIDYNTSRQHVGNTAHAVIFQFAANF